MSWVEQYVATYRGLPPRVWLLAFVVAVNRVGSMVITFMSLYVSNVLHADVESVGRVLTAHGAGAVVGVMAGGALVDRLGSKRIMVVSLLSNAVGFASMSRVDDVMWLAVAMFTMSAVGEAFRPANTTALAGSVPPADLDRAFGLMQLAVNLGTSIGAGLGGVLAAVSYTALFYVDAATAGICALLVLVFLADVRGPAKAKTARTSKSPAGFILFLCGTTMISMLLVQFFTTATLYHNTVNGFSERRIGFLVVVNTLLITFLQMPAAARVARIPMLRVIGTGLVGFACGYALLPFTSLYVTAVVAMVLFTLGELVMFPALNAYVAKAAPPGETGRYMGMSFAGYAVGRLAAPLVGTAVYERAGPVALWWACAATALVVALGYALADRAGRSAA